MLEKDPFIENASNAFAAVEDTQVNIRRPLYGIQIKENRPAFLAIFQTGTYEGKISLVDSSAPGGYSFANHNFILQSVDEQRTEKFQIVETFGDHFTFFYGEKPIILQCSGMLFNTMDFNWKNEWLNNYNNLLRGTKCVENRSRVFLGFDDVLAEGYLLNTHINYDKDLPYVTPFAFQMLLAKPPIDLSESWVKGSEEARTLYATESVTDVGASTLDTDVQLKYVAEYLSAIKDQGKAYVDPATGTLISKEDSDANYCPDSLYEREVTHTATWISGPFPVVKQWKDENEALMKLDAALSAEQAGTDELTAILALRQRATEFPLSKSRAAASKIQKSLNSGVANSAAVVDDAPLLE